MSNGATNSKGLLLGVADSVFRLATLGSLLLYVAQPPLEWGLLAWVAPCCWLWIATRPALTSPRPYLKLWLASWIYWMLTIHWIRLAHPYTIFGLFLLAGYLAVYLPLFVAVVRLGIHHLRLPLLLVAPAAWVAGEWLQAHLMSGFLMGALSHSQIHYQQLIQISDLGGAYGISLVMLLVASALTTLLRSWAARQTAPRWRGSLGATAIAGATLAAAHFYGAQQLATELTHSSDTTRRVALVQGSHRAVWVQDDERDERVMATYERLTDEVARTAKLTGQRLDLIVWPESMHRVGLYTYSDTLKQRADAGRSLAEMESLGPAVLADLARRSDSPLLVGTDRVVVRGEDDYQVYNSAAGVDRQGKLVGTYDKTHLVVFGEFVPFGNWFPWIYRLFMIGELTPGKGPAVFQIEGTRYMPTICYETCVPHVVRGQVAELTAAGNRPEVLVNITNDSWFNDSSELQMHLTCSRLRAIECRTPLVVAANGGLSANVDPWGRVLGVSEPLAEQVLLAEVRPGYSDTLYLAWGDWLALSCVALSGIVVAAGGWSHKFGRSAGGTAS